MATSNEDQAPAAAVPSIKLPAESVSTSNQHTPCKLVKHRPAPLHIQTEAEKFPAFLNADKLPPKAKSMTEAEIKSEVLNDEQISAIAAKLQTDDPPMSLEEARQRREEIKDERKKSIDFIRRRTLSRAGQLGRPNLEALGHPNLEELTEKKVLGMVKENKSDCKIMR